MISPPPEIQNQTYNLPPIMPITVAPSGEHPLQQGQRGPAHRGELSPGEM